MRNLCAILLTILINSIGYTQVPDTLTPEKKARYKIGKIRENTIRAISPADYRNAFYELADLMVTRTPFLSMAELRAGKADSARVVQVLNNNRVWTYKYDPNSAAEDDSATVIRSGSRRYVVESPALSPEMFGYGKSDNSSFLQKAITKASRHPVISLNDTLYISKPILIPANRVLQLQNTVIKATPNFTGEYMVGIQGGFVGQHMYISMNLDGNNKTGLVGLKFSSGQQATGNQFNIQARNLSIGVWVYGNVERQNMSIAAYNCGLALKESEDPATQKNATITPDENYYRITGSNCRQWFYQSGESSSQVNFNVENTLKHTDYAVVIEGKKFVHLTGEIRGNNNGGVRINGGTALSIMLDLGIIGTNKAMALNVQSCRTITGKVLTTRTTYNAVFLGAISYGGLLDLQITGHSGGPALVVGSAAQYPFFVQVNTVIYPVNDSSNAIEFIKADNCEIHVAGADAPIIIPAGSSLLKTKISVPARYISSNRMIKNLSSSYPVISVRGALTISEIEAYQTPVNGLVIESVSDRSNLPASFNGKWNYVGTIQDVKSWGPAEIAANTAISIKFNLTGVKTGSIVGVEFMPDSGKDYDDSVLFTGRVTADGIVKVIVKNDGKIPVNLESGKIKIVVM
jgi:hypothetical protein